MSVKHTKKTTPSPEMRDHYDFSRAKRGRFPDLAGRHVVVLADDVWEHFGSETAVIAALCGLVETAKYVKKPKPRSRRAA